MKIMRTILYLFISLGSCFALGQEKNFAIKIYLEDSYTGRKINDAKVTLEGFEIPEIVGKYDKNGKFYYFTEIPEGYNTVMAYHEKYNEKGFQDVNLMPSELRLELQDLRYVSYVFDEPVLKNISKDYIRTNSYLRKINEKLAKGEKITDPNYKYLYQEDPYHIAILSTLSYEEFASNRSTDSLLNSLSLEFTHFRNSEGGPVEYRYVFDQSNSLIKLDLADRSFDNVIPKYNIYFFHKKDKSKFKRFNCLEINKLRGFGFQVAAVTNRIYEYFADKKFDNTAYDQFYRHNFNIHTYLEYPENYDFGKIRIPQQIFFKNSVEEDQMYFGKRKYRNSEGRLTVDNTIETLYLAMPKQGCNSLGLGVLDIESKDKFTCKFYFFNSLSNIYLNVKK